MLIIHLLHDASAFLHALKLLGARDIIIIGKPYSTVKQTVKEIRDLHYKHILTPSNMVQFNNYISKSLKYALNKRKKVIILEDGGYCIDLINKNSLRSDKLLGIAEQTTIGIWRDKEMLERLRETGEDISYPIINVAETDSKKELESIEVGNAIIRNIDNLLIKMNKMLTGKDIFVVGFGSIGNAVAAALKSRTHVSVYDTIPSRRIKARYLGYNVLSLKKGIKKADIIIGCSGNMWAKHKELSRLKNDVVFVCAA